MLVRNYEHEATISLHWISTLPEFRKQGFGSIITSKALLDAKVNGFTEAVLLSSALGKSVYEKLGFQEYASYKIFQSNYLVIEFCKGLAIVLEICLFNYLVIQMACEFAPHRFMWYYI